MTVNDPSGGMNILTAADPSTPTPARAMPGTEIEVKGKADRTKLPLPPDVEPPTQGWPKFKMGINEWRQKEDPQRPGYMLVPPPNKAERAQRDERDYVETIRSSIVTECDMAKQVGSGMVLFINPKGNGSKTTQSIWTASGLCVETGAEVTVFDANYAAGTVAQRLGFDHGETLTERQLIDNYDVLSTTHRKLNEYLKNNRDRVRVLAASPIIKGGRKLSGDENAKSAQLLRDNCDFLYVDTPNDITGDQCLALIGMATVLVFVVNIGEQDSLRKLSEGMETLREHGFVDKVNHSVVSFSNLPPGAQAADYRKYLNEVNVHNQVVREIPGHVGPLVGIRHDRAIADAQPVVFSALQRETAQDIRLANTAIMSRMPRKSAVHELNGSEHIRFTDSQLVSVPAYEH